MLYIPPPDPPVAVVEAVPLLYIPPPCAPEAVVEDEALPLLYSPPPNAPEALVDEQELDVAMLDVVRMTVLPYTTTLPWS